MNESAKPKVEFKVGDQIEGKDIDRLPPGTELLIVNEKYPSEKRRILVSRFSIWFGKQRGEGWQKNPAQPQHRNGLYAGLYGKFRIEKLGEPGWMHDSVKATLELLEKNGNVIYADPDPRHEGVFYAFNRDRLFYWISDNGEYGAGFKSNEKARIERLKSEGKLKPVKLDPPDDSDIPACR